MTEDAQKVREAVRYGRYRLTAHAEREREADAISVAELAHAFGSSDVEILEEYPEDPRGHSMLALSFTSEGNPLHAVVAVVNDIVIFVTVYRPSPDAWDNWRRRRNA